MEIENALYKKNALNNSKRFLKPMPDVLIDEVLCSNVQNVSVSTANIRINNKYK